jgi:thiol-disulfide isomerase/thioredoxin
MRVQALRSNGIRLTFSPDQVANAEISGKSDVLGPCRVFVSDVDQLLIGNAIETAAAQLVYQRWKLHNAEEPKVSQDDDTSAGGGGGASGTDSALVGKPAPDFTLDLMEGKPFQLAKEKGKVVVLDFWATWCGPCMQTMPQVERVMEEFKDKDVRLVAVNLQEDAKKIASVLERHKMHVTVALDRDGAVAEKYAANAIPQTVIVDREGKIARLFVGGGPHFDDQLRDALKAVLSGEKPKETAK